MRPVLLAYAAMAWGLTALIDLIWPIWPVRIATGLAALAFSVLTIFAFIAAGVRKRRK